MRSGEGEIIVRQLKLPITFEDRRCKQTMTVGRGISFLTFLFHRSHAATAVCCDCCADDWSCMIFDKSVNCTLYRLWHIAYLCFDIFRLILDAFDLRLYALATPSQHTEVSHIRVLGNTHISLSMNSKRPFTAMTASVLSCFNSTGPICL